MGTFNNNNILLRITQLPHLGIPNTLTQISFSPCYTNSLIVHRWKQLGDIEIKNCPGSLEPLCRGSRTLTCLQPFPLGSCWQQTSWVKAVLRGCTAQLLHTVHLWTWFEGLATSPEDLGAVMGALSMSFPRGSKQGWWKTLPAPAFQQCEESLLF